MARTSMSDIIGRVRYLIGDTGTAQFTDDHVQDILDQHKTDVRYNPLMALERIQPGGTVLYLDFWAVDAAGQPVNHWEGTAGTALVLQNGNWSTVTGSATHNTLEGKWTFTDEPTRPIYLTGAFYDVEAAGADLCEEWIADLKKCVTFSVGNTKFDLNAQIDNLEKLTERLRRRQKVRTITAQRTDVNPDFNADYASSDPRGRNSTLGETFRW